MTVEGKKTSGTVLAAAFVLAPVLYVASIGPACWLSSRLGRGLEVVPLVYAPVVRCLSYESLRWKLQSYCEFVAAPGWGWWLSLIPGDDGAESERLWEWRQIPSH